MPHKVASLQDDAAPPESLVWLWQELLKKALGNDRKKYLIASKFGMVKTKDGMSVRGDKQHVREACEASLKRLGTEYIDLYYQHRVDRNVPIEETWTAMKVS